MIVGSICALLIGCVPETPPTTSGTSAPAPPPTSLFGAQVGPTQTAQAMPAAIVYFLQPGGPADAAGVREGDLLLTLGGQQVSSGQELLQALRRHSPDTVVPVGLIREGERLELKVKLGRRPPEAEQTRNWQALMRQRRVEELAAAAEADRRGDHGAALAHGAQAARATVEAGAGANFDEVLVQLAATLQALKSPPPVPFEADRRNRRAIAILESAASDRDNDRAAQEFWWAIYAAPWIADLYLNRGLVLARAGYPRAAATSLRQYLILNPRASDAASVRGKIAELEVASEDQTAWLPFVSDWHSGHGGTQRLTLRGQTLTISVLTADPDTNQKPGDPVCWGQVHGTRFEGRCSFWFSTDQAKACFGSKREYEADGGIVGDELQIDAITNINYNTETCAINSETRGHRIRLRKAQSS